MLLHCVTCNPSVLVNKLDAQPHFLAGEHHFLTYEEPVVVGVIVEFADWVRFKRILQFRRLGESYLVTLENPLRTLLSSLQYLKKVGN